MFEDQTAKGVILIKPPLLNVSLLCFSAFFIATCHLGSLPSYAKAFLVANPISKGGDLIHAPYMTAMASFLSTPLDPALLLTIACKRLIASSLSSVTYPAPHAQGPPPGIFMHLSISTFVAIFFLNSR